MPVLWITTRGSRGWMSCSRGRPAGLGGRSLVRGHTSFDCAYAESWITVEYAYELDRRWAHRRGMTPI
jgi:hypothetical protein